MCLVSLYRKAYYYGQGRFCPVCEKTSRRFRTYGFIPRQDAQCVYCGALERHRLSWVFITQRTNLFDGYPKKMLHVAPEPCFEPRFRRKLGSSYITADLFNSKAMLKMDITNIDFTDRSFDVIYCSHVLEHVQDDLQAMREFYRVLKPGGWAILLVPIYARKTYEDASITSPQDRLLAFGQADHVRKYGTDYVDRLRNAGFRVKVVKVSDLLSPDDVVTLGLVHTEREIYFCEK
jgi:SAM-dependent methyltransferase